MRANADHLDRRITIEVPVETPDAAGQAVPAWSTFAEVWAEVKPESGGESFETDRRTNSQRVVFRIRYLAGVTTKMRVVWNGQVHEIEDIREPDRLVTLELVTEIREKVSGVVVP